MKKVIESLIDYAFDSSSIERLMAAAHIGEEKRNETGDLAMEFLRQWNAAQCDKEGPTKEQDPYLDALLEEYATKLLSL